jgi:signal transduction histidine kinase
VLFRREVDGLLTLRVSHEGRSVETTGLGDGFYVIGRDRSCDIVIEDKTASRRHARLEVAGEVVVIEDLDSRNGTFVQGKRVRKSRLFAGTTVTIGEHQMTFDGLPAATGVVGGDPPESVGQTAILSSLDARIISRGEDIKGGLLGPEALASRLALFYQLGKTLCGRLGASDIAESFLDVMLEAFPGADRALVLLDGGPDRGLYPLAAKGRASGGVESRVSTTVAGAVLGKRQSVLCRDTTTDERFKQARSVLDLRIRSVMCVPLLVGDKALGMVEVDCLKGGDSFNVEDLRLLTGLASQVAVALENDGLYSEIEKAQRLAAIGQTVAGAAHCVKNVLNGVEGGLFIARRGLESEDQEKTRKGWEMLERNSGFLKTMVLDMLDYSKERVVEYAEADLVEMLGEVVALVEGKAAEAGVTVSLDIDPALGRVTLDAKRIKRALVNIASNAVEATPSGGKVSVSAEPRPGGMFAIRVSDTGAGIPEEMIQRIFEPFYSTKGSKGTGLGLPVARKIVEEHRGRMDLESRVGAGTTFTITLPVSQEP